MELMTVGTPDAAPETVIQPADQGGSDPFQAAQPESPEIPADGLEPDGQQPQVPTGAYLDGDYIVIPNKSGNGTFTRVALSTLPDVWHTQHENYSLLNRKATTLEAQLQLLAGNRTQGQEPQQPAAKTKTDKVALVRQALVENGLEDDEPFARAIAKVLDATTTETVQDITAEQAQARFDAWNEQYTELANKDRAFNVSLPENEAARMVMDWAEQNNVAPDKAYQRFLKVTGRQAPGGAQQPTLKPDLAAQIEARTQQRANSGVTLQGGNGATPQGQRRVAYPPHVLEAVRHYRDENPSATKEDLQWIADYTLKTNPTPGGN